MCFPLQLVMYPIINLRRHKMDLHWYLRTLEEVVIRVLSSTFSIQASRKEGLTGVWVGKFQLHLLLSISTICLVIRSWLKLNEWSYKINTFRSIYLVMWICLWICLKNMVNQKIEGIWFCMVMPLCGTCEVGKVNFLKYDISLRWKTM